MPNRIRGITFSLNLWSRRSDNITSLVSSKAEELECLCVSRQLRWICGIGGPHGTFIFCAHILWQSQPYASLGACRRVRWNQKALRTAGIGPCLKCPAPSHPSRT
jgi:hypothetical protein